MAITTTRTRSAVAARSPRARALGASKPVAIHVSRKNNAATSAAASAAAEKRSSLVPIPSSEPKRA